MSVRKEPLTEEAFRVTYEYQPEPKVKLWRAFKEECLCSKNTLPNLFPIAKWLPKYKVKENLFGDVVSGITVAIMHIPHGLAYSQLGGVPPVIGLYMAVFPIVVYVIMGTSKHISLGTFAVLCAMAGEVGMKVTHSVGDRSPEFAVSVASAITLVVGLWQTILSLLRMGSLTVYLSQSLVAGFTAGAAVHVFTFQFKNLLGINVESYSGPLKLIYIYIDIFSHLGETNVVTLGLSLSFITLLLVFNYYIKPLMQRRLPRCKVLFPIELVVVTLGIIISYCLDLNEKYGVRIVANVPTGLPVPQVPPHDIIPKVIVSCFPLAVVGISINLSMAKIFARKDNYEISSKQEILAYGMCNVFSSFFQCLPSAASLSRSVIQYGSGGKTQLANVFSMAIMILILLFIGRVFEPVPYCVLSSIVLVTVLSLIFQLGDLPRVFRLSKLDGLVWITTFLSVVIIDIDYGLLIGFVASIGVLLWMNHRPQLMRLGTVDEKHVYLDVSRFRAVDEIQNVVIAKLIGGLNFSNESSTFSKIVQFLREADVNLNEKYAAALVLDMSGVSYVDPTASSGLVTLAKDAARLEFRTFLAGCSVKVYNDLKRVGFTNQFPMDHIFATVDDAVFHATRIDLLVLPDRSNPN